MSILKKIQASMLMAMIFLCALKGARAGSEDAMSYPSSLDAAFNLQWAKMAIENVISHYLQTGEWKQLGCPAHNSTQSKFPFQYVWCFVDDGEEYPKVLHPRLNELKQSRFKKAVYQSGSSISNDVNECSCDHHTFWTLPIYAPPWANYSKVSLATKIFASERDDPQNYDACSPTPGDTVFMCGAGVWEEYLDW